MLALPPGHMLENYRVLRVLGEGGFGITYLGEDVHSERRVAIKELLPRDIATRVGGGTVVPTASHLRDSFQWALDNFVREARALAKLHHANIVPIHRLFPANGTACMVMDYVDGQSMKQWLQDCPQPTEQQLRSLLDPLLDGLEHVHQNGLLHRDIKPDNIYITREGRPVLLDFGSARPDVGQTQTVTTVVSAGYSPFEQYQSKTRQTPASDLYALAAVMVRAITGTTPANAVDRIVEDSRVTLTESHGHRFSGTFTRSVEAAFAVRAQDRTQSVAEWRRMLAPPLVREDAPPAVPKTATVKVTLDHVVAKPARWTLPPQVPPRIPGQPAPSEPKKATVKVTPLDRVDRAPPPPPSPVSARPAVPGARPSLPARGNMQGLTAAPLPLGHLINGHRVVRVLGGGNAAYVYLTEQIHDGRRAVLKEYFPAKIAGRVAGKAIRPAALWSGTFDKGKERFLAEARTIARVIHPSIVPVKSIFQANDTAYFSMNLVPGLSLAQWLAQIPTNPQELLQNFLYEVLSGLEKAHAAGLLHCDIQPDTLLVAGGGSPILLGFAAAKYTLIDASQGRHPQTHVNYRSPEMLDVRQTRTAASDIYALAAVVIGAISKAEPPGAAVRLRDQRAHIPLTLAPEGVYTAGFLQALEQGFALAPKDRPRSAAEWRIRLTGRY